MSYLRVSGPCCAEVILADEPFAEGSFKIVWLGKYKDGDREGQRCVAKEFKEGSVFEDYYFEEEMRLIWATSDIVENFNEAGILGAWKVRVNIPEIGTGRDGEMKGLKCLVEPFIENFEKFNSNSGWVNPNGGVWGDAIQALSHFSYHDSGGEYLLCDLQGGSHKDGL
jgi:Alpha-kinase family